MNIIVNGQNITLNQQQFVAKGGEAMVFNSGNVAYKIYEDLKKMVPKAKLKELSTLTIPNIVAPRDLIYNKKQEIIGFTMAWLGDTIALCKLFTSGFRNANSVTDDLTLELIENIKDTTAYIHENGFLIVDGNELNYMVDKDFVTPYFIDVNAWQTPSFPPTAIMPSIRDYSKNTFDKNTDWFSFAVVSFQLFTGVHPFKGKHPKFKKMDFESRVKACVSVLNPEVRIPPNVRDFGIIPVEYMDWYMKLFEKGERMPPPLKAGKIGHVKTRIILVTSTDNFDIKELQSFDTDIIFHNIIGGNQIVKTKETLYIDKLEYKVSPDVEILFTPMEGIPVFAKIEDGYIKLHSPDNYYKILPLVMKCTEKMIVNNILYLKNKEMFIELAFNVMGQNITIAPKTVWTIEPNSSQILSNVIFQSVLGKAFIAIPLPTYAKSKFILKQIPEFDDYRVIDGKHENGICMFTLHKNGEYSRATLVFDPTYNRYKIEIKDGIDYTPINFVVLDNGVCISINDEDKVEIFTNKIDKPDIKIIEDPEVNSEMKLCHDGVQTRVFKGEKLFTIKMR